MRRASAVNTSIIFVPTSSITDCELELRGQALLDAVDDRELGGALLGLLQEPLGLVDEARALQRHAHARRDRLEQADVALAQHSHVVLEADVADHAPEPPMIGTKASETLTCVPGVNVTRPEATAAAESGNRMD